MTPHIISTPTGEVALVLNHTLILAGEAADDSAKLVHQTGERLAAALGKSAIVVNHSPTTAEWEWPDLIKEIGKTSAPTVCGKCGSMLIGGMCRDETCPYSDWPQQVPVEDIESLAPDDIVAKHGLIRASMHSDDRVLEAPFFAQEWFIGASDDSIKTLYEDEWSHSDEADAVARSAEHVYRVELVFNYIRAYNRADRDAIGFECTVNRADAMAWLRRHRHGLWCQLMCLEHEVDIVEAQEPEVAGRFDWLDGHGNACEMSFVSEDVAAMDAVERLGLDPLAPVTPLFSAFWDVGAFYSPTGKDIHQIVGPAMFCDALCYNPDDIKEINALAVGDEWESPHYGRAHVVRRVR